LVVLSGSRKVVTPGPALFFPAVATDKSDQPGVLGNLPRSRPGQRSEKRAASRAAVAATAAKPAGRAPKRKPASGRRKPASAPPPREQPVPEPAAGSPDPLSAAFHLAGTVAGLGLKAAGGILRRLPGR
jgi:hypothetical protein